MNLITDSNGGIKFDSALNFYFLYKMTSVLLSNNNSIGLMAKCGTCDQNCNKDSIYKNKYSIFCDNMCYSIGHLVKGEVALELVPAPPTKKEKPVIKYRNHMVIKKLTVMPGSIQEGYVRNCI